jgi:hypothetical protein
MGILLKDWLPRQWRFRCDIAANELPIECDDCCEARDAGRVACAAHPRGAGRRPLEGDELLYDTGLDATGRIGADELP